MDLTFCQQQGSERAPRLRLTAADYSNGTYFHYTHDAVGNRLSETTLAGTTTYSYDDANRLVSAGGKSYTWDANGNLLADGVYTYTFSAANRLVAVEDGLSIVSEFAYNGLGDRVSQESGEETIFYKLDLAAGLTQVLADNEHSYLYGNGRIAQYGETGREYFLGDSLGSVRQLAGEYGEITLTRNYKPYGEILSSAGYGESAFAFTGEAYDTSTNLIYLRARFYAPSQGRFTSRDVWVGDYYQPMSYNAWLYGYANPIKYIDPSGLYGEEVHYRLTSGRVLQWLKYYPIPALQGEIWKLADVIASWDQRVDTSLLLLPFKASCAECHFMSYESTISHIEYAIETEQPYLFGAALHQLQDYYSHWGEGYHDPMFGHAKHTILARRRDATLLQEFNMGCRHIDGSIPMCVVLAPYPAHPRSEIVRDIRQRNPNLSLSGLSDWDIVDLYLRLGESTISNPNVRMKERGYFGFDTDKYIPSSSRDLLMLTATDQYIIRFLLKLSKEACSIDLELPPNAEKETNARLVLTR